MAHSSPVTFSMGCGDVSRRTRILLAAVSLDSSPIIGVEHLEYQGGVIFLWKCLWGWGTG